MDRRDASPLSSVVIGAYIISLTCPPSSVSKLKII